MTAQQTRPGTGMGLGSGGGPGFGGPQGALMQQQQQFLQVQHNKLTFDFYRMCGKIIVVDSDFTAAINYPNTAVPAKEPTWSCSCIEPKAPDAWYYGLWDGCCYCLTASPTNVNNRDTHKLFSSAHAFSFFNYARVVVYILESTSNYYLLRQVLSSKCVERVAISIVDFLSIFSLVYNACIYSVYRM